MSNTPKQWAARELAERDIAGLEDALKNVLELADHAHHSVMRASEEIGNKHGTGYTHPSLGLMEVAVRTLNQGNDAARYSRQALRYPPSTTER